MGSPDAVVESSSVVRRVNAVASSYGWTFLVAVMVVHVFAKSIRTNGIEDEHKPGNNKVLRQNRRQECEPPNTHLAKVLRPGQGLQE
jgi:hypothetical protein